jgi:hypothetical protein
MARAAENGGLESFQLYHQARLAGTRLIGIERAIPAHPTPSTANRAALERAFARRLKSVDGSLERADVAASRCEALRREEFLRPALLDASASAPDLRAKCEPFTGT